MPSFSIERNLHSRLAHIDVRLRILLGNLRSRFDFVGHPDIIVAMDLGHFGCIPFGLRPDHRFESRSKKLPELTTSGWSHSGSTFPSGCWIHAVLFPHSKCCVRRGAATRC